MIKLNLLLKFLFAERIGALNEQKERKGVKGGDACPVG